MLSGGCRLLHVRVGEETWWLISWSHGNPKNSRGGRRRENANTCRDGGAAGAEDVGGVVWARKGKGPLTIDYGRV